MEEDVKTNQNSNSEYAFQNESSSSNSSQNVSSFDFLLFLILILLVLGNKDTFSGYFRIFDREVNKLTNILNAFQNTAESLKQTFSTDFKI
ncbi:hypothetical protein [Natronospora cellulosivora (SeqCode)]